MPKLQVLPENTVYQLVKNIQNNHRYRVDEILQDGETRILKRCKDPALKSMLQHDVQSSFYLEAARSYNIESVFRVRKIYSYGEDWYVAEKLEGEVLYDKEVAREVSEDLTLARNLYAPFIYETSIYTPQVMLGKYTYRNASGQPNGAYKEIMQKLEEWSSVAMKENFLQASQAATIRSFVAKHLTEVQYGVELYDLEPWEMFVLPEYKLGVIDLEYLNLRGRRHFDIVYNYLRLWLDAKRPPVAMETLRRYAELCGSERMDGAFLSLFGYKLVGYLRDAACWMHDTRKYGKPVIYSHEDTEPILERYLNFSIRALYENRDG